GHSARAERRSHHTHRSRMGARAPAAAVLGVYSRTGRADLSGRSDPAVPEFRAGSLTAHVSQRHRMVLAALYWCAADCFVDGPLLGGALHVGRVAAGRSDI